MAGTVSARRGRYARWIILGVAAIYFLLPMGAAAWYAVYNDRTGLHLGVFTRMFDMPNFTQSFMLSVYLSVFTVVFTLVLMVPTALLLHLKMPRMRRAIDFACLLPLVVPPVVLVVGISTVLQWGPNSLAGTPVQSFMNWLQLSSFPVIGSVPVILVFAYMVMALPFTYRALDSGLKTSNITNLVEAARSLGADWGTVLLRIVVPALRTAILNSAFLAFALAFGEFTVASILNFVTFTPWILQYGQTDGQLSTALSIESLMIVWVILLVITAFGRQKTGPSFGSRLLARFTPQQIKDGA